MTSISTYSKGIDLAQPGYNRDGDQLPQINLAMFKRMTVENVVRELGKIKVISSSDSPQLLTSITIKLQRTILDALSLSVHGLQDATK